MMSDKKVGMSKREFTELTEKLIDQILPQVGGIVLDIGTVNDLCIEIRRRKAEWALEADDE
jgi:hypothetical protein